MKQNYFSQFSNLLRQLSLATIVFTSIQASAQTISWIKEAGDNNRFTWAQGVSIDHHHNEIISGFQNGNTHFGSTILPFYGNFDAYLAKYDSSGILLWVNDIGGTDDDKAYRTVIDDSDNIYIVGGFVSNHLRFSSTDSMAITSAGNQNFFLAKYDKNGNFLWSRNGGKATPASYACYAKAVTIDPSGNVIIGGYYSASMLIAGTTTTLPGTSGTVGVFVIKYAPNGTLIWADNVLSIANCAINAIACDNAGNIFVTGKNDDYMFTPADTIVKTNPGDHMFLFKYNSSGVLQWADTLGKMLWTGSTDNTITSGNDLAVDNLGNIYVAGNWLDTEYLVYDTVLSMYVPFYRQYGFLAKYSNSGAQTWMQKFGGDNILYQGSIEESDQANGVALDANGYPYVVGDFVSNTTFGGLSMTLPTFGTGFIGKFDPATGNAIWIKTGGGLNGNQSLNITIDQNGGDIATTGVFQNFVNFDAITVNSTSTVMTYQDIYLTRHINPVTSGALSIAPINNIPYTIYPNPAAAYINIDLPDGVYHKVLITNLRGQTVLTTDTNNPSLQIDIQSLKPGNYTISVVDQHNVMVSSKLVKL